MAQLADQLSCPPALAQIAAEAGLSRYQLVRSFRAEVGMPPYAWLAQHRVARARVLLEQGCRPAEAGHAHRIRRPGPPDPVVPAGGRGDARDVLQQRSRQRDAYR